MMFVPQAVYWTFLMIGVVCTVGGMPFFFGKLKNHVIASTLLGIGVTALVGTYVQKEVSKELADDIVNRSKTNFAELSEDEAASALKRAAGDKSIGLLVFRSVLNGGLIRRNYEYNAVLTAPDDKDDADYFKIHATLSFELQNHSAREEPFTVNLEAFFLDGPPGKDDIVYTHYKLTRKDDHGVLLPNYPVELWRSELQKDVSRGELSAKLSKFGKIGPDETADVLLETDSWEQRRYGQLAVLTSMKTIEKMSVTVAFPPGSFEGLKRDVQHIYDGCGDGGNTVCRGATPDAASAVVSASINGAVLPQNGIIVSWKARPVAKK